MLEVTYLQTYFYVWLALVVKPWSSEKKVTGSNPGQSPIQAYAVMRTLRLLRGERVDYERYP